MLALPAEMTAIAIRAPGEADALVPEQRPLPRPGKREVLVKVVAAGVNRPDVMQRQGLYPPPAGATDVPGLEIAGEVVALVAAAKAGSNGRGADVILDMVGGDYIERNYEAAAVEGRVVQIAFQGSSKASVDFRRIMLKRLTHTGSTLRARSVPDKGALAKAVEMHVLPLIASGKVRPLIDSTFPFIQACAAHAHGDQCAYWQDRPDIRNSLKSFGFRSCGPTPRRSLSSLAGREIDVNRRKVRLPWHRVSPEKARRGSMGVELGGRRLNFVRACVTAMLLVFALGAPCGRAVEAINVRTDAQ